MGFDQQRAAVVTGDGVVARYSGVLCVAWCTDREPLRRLLEICADTAGVEPGRALARRLVTWLAGPETPGDALVFGTVAAAGEQLAVFLSGTAGVEIAGTGLAVSGADSASWTDRLLPRPDTALVLALDGSASAGATDVGLFDLREGIVPGAGVVLLPGADPGPGPGFARDDAGWSAPTGRSNAPAGYGGYSGDAVATGGGGIGGSGRPAVRDDQSYGQAAEEPQPRRGDVGGSRRSRRLAGRHLSPDPEQEAAAAPTDGLDTPPVGVPAPVTPAHAVPAVQAFVTPEQAPPSHQTNGHGDIDGYPEKGYAENGYSDNGYSDNRYPENGYAENGYAENGYAENGYAENGYAENGYRDSGHRENGHAGERSDSGAALDRPSGSYSANGYAENGYRENGYGENGYASNGYAVNGYQENGNPDNGYAEAAQAPVAAPAQPEESGQQEEEDFSAGEWFDAGGTAPTPAVEEAGAVWTEPGQVQAEQESAQPVAQETPQEASQQALEPDHGPAEDDLAALGRHLVPPAAAAEPQPASSEPVTPVTAVPAVPEPQPVAQDLTEDAELPGPPVRAEQIMGVAPGDTPRTPLEAGVPIGSPAAVGAGGPDDGPMPQAQGHLCARGHLNDPRAHFCVLCGIRMNERTGVLVMGARPPLGLIVFDDGATYTVDAEYLVGRMPEADPRVRSGALRSIVIEDRTGAVSRVHAEIRVSGWDVMLSDSGSRNGTFVAGASETGWTPLSPGRGRRLVPGTRVRIGGRSFVFESPSGVR